MDWEAFYSLPEGVSVSVGDRVRVDFAYREYVGVVSVVQARPGELEEKTVPIKGVEPHLPAVHPREVAFWRVMAEYYLCSVGEVYKTACPDRIVNKVLKRKSNVVPGKDVHEAAPLRLSSWQEKAAHDMDVALSKRKTLLLEGADKTNLYLQMARETLQKGRSVLYLVPEIALTSQLEERVGAVFPAMLTYHSELTPARRRKVASAVREEADSFVLGTRSALFLPHHNLGLIIVDEEQDNSYKQDAPAPRYHAREASILLAAIHGAQVILGSDTPSLESLYNADSRLFEHIDIKQYFYSENRPSVQLVNIAAEARKNGMSGSFSLKLLEQMHRALDAGEKQLVVCRSKTEIPDCMAELETIFGSGVQSITLATPASAKALPAREYALTAILLADNLLAKEDFRCDERAFQALSMIADRCHPDGLLLIQTREPSHPVFSAFSTPDFLQGMLSQRRQFAFPPFTRLIHIVLKDNNVNRLKYLGRELQKAVQTALPGVPVTGTFEQMGIIRITLARDKKLKPSKRILAQTVSDFERERKYDGHVFLDVDPL
ncbi:MAG: hypothetical protein J5669_04920 [Bacteroidales bacterium]|nr:hypothetical protein [Bacteroidales bacterium]